MEDIPEEFVPLKNFFHSLVDMAIEKRHRIVILLGGRHPEHEKLALVFDLLRGKICTLSNSRRVTHVMNVL